MILKIERKKHTEIRVVYGRLCVSKCLSVCLLPVEGSCLCLMPRGIDGNPPPAQEEPGEPLQGPGLEVLPPSFSPFWGSV